MPTSKFIKAHQKPAPHNTVHFEVLLDDTKVLADGQPDPRYVRSHVWGAQPPTWTEASLNGVVYTDYHAYIAAETQLLAQSELARIVADESVNAIQLPMQGTTF